MMNLKLTSCRGLFLFARHKIMLLFGQGLVAEAYAAGCKLAYLGSNPGKASIPFIY